MSGTTVTPGYTPKAGDTVTLVTPSGPQTVTVWELFVAMRRLAQTGGRDLTAGDVVVPYGNGEEIVVQAGLAQRFGLTQNTPADVARSILANEPTGRAK